MMYFGIDDGPLSVGRSGMVMGIPEHRVLSMKVHRVTGFVEIWFTSHRDKIEVMLSSHVDHYNRPLSEWKDEWVNNIECAESAQSALDRT